MTNLGSTLKSRDIILLTKVHLVKAMVYPVVHVWMWELDHKSEHQRTDAFVLWCWRLLTVSWTARRSNQSILKEISLEFSLKGLMLKLKLQYFGHLMWRTDSLEKKKNPDAGKDWRQEQTGMSEDELIGHHLLDGHEFEQALGVGDGPGSLAVHGVAKSRTWLSNWTELNWGK